MHHHIVSTSHCLYPEWYSQQILEWVMQMGDADCQLIQIIYICIHIYIPSPKVSFVIK